LGIGDDAAVLQTAPDKACVVSADAVVEDIHFRRAWHTPRQIGRKAAAVNISDMAAMGAVGRWLICQAGLPRGTGLGFLKECLAGLADHAARHGMALVGGDLTSTAGPFFLAVTILGEAPPGGTLTRAGARPGHLLAVSGTPGESAAGLLLLTRGVRGGFRGAATLVRRHLEPEPRVLLSRLAVASGAVRGAIDLSDGLSTDLDHLCRRSGCRAVVEVDRLPISPSLLAGSRRLGRDPLDLLLHGGEDYQLLLALEPDRAEGFLDAARRAGERVTVIGRFTAGSPGVWLRRDTRLRRLRPGGFDHFAPSPP
jgi:thiamine-monophosphate kinase